MNKSDAIDQLATALAKAQAEMAAAPKSAINPHFKSKYAPLNEVIGVAKVLAKHGLSFVQPATTIDNSSVVMVETVLLHSSGQWISETISLRPQQNTPQGIGSALTYARRYGLSSLLGIAADEDDDGNAASTGNGKHAPAAPSSALSPEDVARIQSQACTELKAALANAPDKKALESVAAEVSKARRDRLITDDQAEKVLGPAYISRLKELNGKAEVKA